MFSIRVDDARDRLQQVAGPIVTDSVYQLIFWDGFIVGIRALASLAGTPRTMIEAIDGAIAAENSLIDILPPMAMTTPVQAQEIAFAITGKPQSTPHQQAEQPKPARCRNCKQSGHERST